MQKRKSEVSEHEKWLDEVLPNHKRLTESVVTIIQSLLKSKGVDYLSVTGRTKKRENALEKIERKKYDNPLIKMTDLSGIRVIVYFESDIERVSKIIDEAFNIDKDNSLNQDQKLSVNQIGYRSVHFVCDIGKERETLSENKGLKDLKFEIQVRTVLQHAWAELAHDSNYKFTEKLPPKIERTINLYAGMLELADKGFNELSKKIDNYVESIQQNIKDGDLEHAIDTISLREFVENWADKNNIKIRPLTERSDLSKLIEELEQFGITSIKELNEIISNDYANLIKDNNIISTIFGHVRRWMLIYDFNKYKNEVDFEWFVSQKMLEDMEVNLTPDRYKEFIEVFKNDIKPFE
ncbi:TPA: GTP pyrophosphokinase [Providencia rettgeri]|nr:GTP pyrophosphokinase [Providencia rettgeri]HEM8338280.1 GTP pyrophosphokinase [Providencia rettgeri]